MSIEPPPIFALCGETIHVARETYPSEAEVLCQTKRLRFTCVVTDVMDILRQSPQARPCDACRVLQDIKTLGLEFTGGVSLDPGDIKSHDYVAPPCKVLKGPHAFTEDDGGLFCEACGWQVRIGESHPRPT